MESPSLEIHKIQLVTELSTLLYLTVGGLEGLQRCISTSTTPGLWEITCFGCEQSSHWACVELLSATIGAEGGEGSWKGSMLCSWGVRDWILGEALAVQRAVTWALLLPSDGPLPAPFLPAGLFAGLPVVLSPFHSMPHHPGTHLPVFSFSALLSPFTSLPFPSGFSDTWLLHIHPLQSDGQHGHWKGTLMKDHTAFSNWKFFYVQLKLLELLWINIVGILSRSGKRRPSGGFVFPYPCSWKCPSWLGLKPEGHFSLASRLETLSQELKVCQCCRERN